MDPVWEREKLEAWRRLWEDLEIGYLDTDILDVLVEFFLRPGSYSKSSCSGRITVIDAKYPWAKEETMTVFKKHEPVTVEEIRAVLGRPWSTRLWLSVQGPIYHVYTYSLEEARILLEAAREAGFKHSGILVPSEHPLVELRTGIRADILLADGDTVIVGEDEKLQHAVNVANEVLLQAKKRNERLLQALRYRRPARLWEPAVEEARRRGWL
ncbi:conserved archaeal protein [Hyperthermus butylicus DSM 5456]|uniref:tRNA(Phe) 7-((3-amino-3-carboxypropyl)-4-demethylwyosine(37)-N(4))-methyltransferase n=1 Tax=Hyperthermus butylicus (strain DSM 5456 / JCM 9403 / PLM1-5) TaxID=415426 RepID=A2BLX0_HYPBU|nr:conserved archaeal protein [Hyperthermus butylicus DSM 5456]